MADSLVLGQCLSGFGRTSHEPHAKHRREPARVNLEKSLSSWERPPNGLELSCPAEAGSSPGLSAQPAGETSTNQGPARRVSFSELII